MLYRSKIQIGQQEKIQNAVACTNDENKQLKETARSLRDRLENKDVQRIEELQLAEKNKCDELSQLKEIINILREKLEVQNGDED